MGVLITVGVVYVVGAGVAAVMKGLSPFEFPDWKWPVALVLWLGVLGK